MTRSVFDITIDFEKSQGSYVFDKKTKKPYLDMFSMFSSLPLGYNHPVFDETFDYKIKHIAHLRMCNNLFHSEELASFVEKFKRISFHENLHLCATGALAVETALKCAFEYKKAPDSIVVGLQNSFHGIHSWGFITDNNLSSVQSRVEHFPRNDWQNISIDKVVSYITENVSQISSVVIEPIQCTAGDIHLSVEKIKEIEAVCKEHKICFIVDEIQTGFGTTGDFWYSEKVGLDPDIVVFGKKSQVCGVMVNDQFSEAIFSKVRKLEVTFDGDLIDAIRSEYVLNAIEKYALLENVNKKSDLLRNELSDQFDNYRSVGHLIAFDFQDKKTRDGFVSSAYENNLLVNPTGEKSVRIRPNLALSDDELDDFFLRIKKSRN